METQSLNRPLPRLSPAPSVCDESILATARRLRAGETSAEALTEQALERIADRDGDLLGFVHVMTDAALRDAREADRELREGIDRGPMHGIAIGLKDVIDVAGEPTSCQSKLRAGHVATDTAFVVRRLAEAGAIILGKTNTWQYCLGQPGPNLPYPPARNPRFPDRIPGGSSSGSGTAVAAGYVRAALGTDSAGSVRYPAGSCGVVGIKPTFGLVGRSGVFPLSGTLDHIGVIAGSVADAAVTLGAITGWDPDDLAGLMPPPCDYLADLDRGLAGLTIGLPRALYAHGDGPSDQVDNLLAFAALAERAGAEVREVETPDYDQFNLYGTIVLLGEAYRVHHADLARREAAYDPPAFEALMRGAAYSLAEIDAARRACARLRVTVSRLFDEVDVLMLPTMLRPPLRIGEMSGPENVLTKPFNMTGHPALAVPFGRSAEGLPLSVQVVGRHFDEAMVFRVGRAVEALDAALSAPPSASSR